MADRPLTKKRVVAAVRWRVRRLRKRLFGGPGGGPAATPAGVAGMVEQFTKDKVTGWVAVPTDAPPVRVSLRVNDLEVAATWATDTSKLNNWGEIRPFDFRVRDVWTYSRKGYKVTVRVDGKSMPIAAHGMFLKPPRDGRYDLAALKAKFEGGYIFGQTGKLQLSKKLDTEWQRRVTGLYAEVRSIVAEAYGYHVFFIYGTLLGAVREGGVIGHDLDFDSAYISRHTDGPTAAKELQDIAFLLVDKGFDVECMRTALHIHDAVDPATRIDLFHLYFNEAGLLSFPFGVAGTTEITRDDWRGTKPTQFCGASGLVPANDEQFVEHMYGAGWRSPKPGFDWKRDRTKRDWKGVLPLEYGEDVYWANFYARTDFDSGSSFCELVGARPDTPPAVIDIGCGDGRDSYAFGLTGRTVLGLDRSEVGVRHASAKAERMGFGDRVRFQACDVTDDAALRAVLSGSLAEVGGPVLFYLRFFLHSITEEAQAALMATVAEVARPGDLLAAEFRTDKDEALAKAYGRHFRRYQNGPAFGVELKERYGFEVLAEQEGTGLAPYKDEDPELYRVIARRNG